MNVSAFHYFQCFPQLLPLAWAPFFIFWSKKVCVWYWALHYSSVFSGGHYGANISLNLKANLLPQSPWCCDFFCYDSHLRPLCFHPLHKITVNSCFSYFLHVLVLTSEDSREYLKKLNKCSHFPSLPLLWKSSFQVSHGNNGVYRNVLSLFEFSR